MSKVDRRRARVARIHLVAKDLWLARVPVPDISRELGVPPGKVWRWRTRFKWPTRAPVRDKKEKLLPMAEKCWRDGLPRKEIALLCEIANSTLYNWRVRYGWPKRPPGIRRGAGLKDLTGPELLAREKALKARWERREVEREQQAAAAVLKIRTNRRWRCCDLLLDVPVCPSCQRRWPLCA